MGQSESDSATEELGEMSQRRGSKKNSRLAVTRVPYDVVRIETRSDYSIWVEFADGTKGTVVLKSFLFQPRPGVFKPLQDPAKFAEAYVHADGFVAWPGGQDLAPDRMHDDIKATGRCVPGPFERG